MIWLSDLFSCQKHFFRQRLACDDFSTEQNGYPVTVTCFSRYCQNKRHLHKQKNLQQNKILRWVRNKQCNSLSPERNEGQREPWEILQIVLTDHTRKGLSYNTRTLFTELQPPLDVTKELPCFLLFCFVPCCLGLQGEGSQHLTFLLIFFPYLTAPSPLALSISFSLCRYPISEVF